MMTMPARGPARLILWLALLGAPLAAQPADPVAMVEDPVGQAMVKPATGEPAKPLEHGDALMPKDRLQLASSGRVTLVFVATLQKREVPGALDLPVEALASGSPLPAAASTAPRFTGLVSVLSAPQLEPESVRRSALPRTVRGRRRGFVDLLYPRNTRIREARPTFSWKAVPGADGYELSVLAGTLEPLIDRQVVSGTQFLYPESAPPLAEDRPYFWQVRARGAGRRPGPLVYFSRLGSVELARVDRELQALTGTVSASAVSAGTAAILAGTRLQRAGLSGEALSVMRSAFQRDPKHRSLAQAIRVVNASTGRHWGVAESD